MNKRTSSKCLAMRARFDGAFVPCVECLSASDTRGQHGVPQASLSSCRVERETHNGRATAFTLTTCFNNREIYDIIIILSTF